LKVCAEESNPLFLKKIDHHLFFFLPLSGLVTSELPEIFLVGNALHLTSLLKDSGAQLDTPLGVYMALFFSFFFFFFWFYQVT